MGTIQIDGSTPKLTIGNATAEDATILFDGNAQDFYIALDDSADDLLIGLGSTVGTTPAISIDENLKVNIPVTTASTSASTGSLTTGGGAGIGADLYVGDDVYLITDSAVLGFGADKDTLLTHTDGTGLTLNSTNKLCFNDASQFIQGSSGTVLSIGATDEIDLTATAVDLNGTLNVSGVATFQSTPVFPDGSLALADLDIDGGTDIGADIVDADLFIVDDGAGGTNRKVTASRLKTYAGGANTPYFQASVTSNQTITNDTATVISFDRADVDSASGYDTTNKKYVIPSGQGGYWHIGFGIAVAGSDDTDIKNINIYPKKGGSDWPSFNARHQGVSYYRFDSHSARQFHAEKSFIGIVSAADEISLTAILGHNDGGSNTLTVGEYYSIFWGYKLAGT